MPRPIRAIIHLDAIRHNLHYVKSHLAKPVFVWAVVKANAYGHGLKRILPALAEADGLALIELDQAICCRELGYQKPILLLEGFFEPSDLPFLDRYQISTVIHHRQQLEWLEHYRFQMPIQKLGLKLNTGMNRLGFEPSLVGELYPRLNRLKLSGQFHSLGLMTHLARADELDLATTYHVMDRLDAIRQAYEWGWVSVANSAASFQLGDRIQSGDEIRPGICLYGSSPFAWQTFGKDLSLKPAMTLQAQILSIQNIEAGEQVGYGGLFQATRATRVAVIACGYADGYPRVAPTGTPTMVRGRRAPLIGRVSMDMLCIDVSHIPEAQLGDWVTLWGQDLSIDEVAHHAGTLGYELMCALAPRVPVLVEC